MLVLGIETSCDETGVALYDGDQRKLLAHAVHSQVAMHEAYGGVVPELASRDHIQRLVPLTRRILDQAGRKIGDLVKEPLWAVVQQQPSAAVFPDGEGLAAVQARAVAAVREHDRTLTEQHEGDVLWLACTHGDVIKAVVADALGTHLDSFQRITADPASMSVIRYTSLRPFVVHVNHTGDQLASGLAAKPVKTADGESKDVPSSDAVVGGSTD